MLGSPTFLISPPSPAERFPAISINSLYNHFSVNQSTSCHVTFTPSLLSCFPTALNAHFEDFIFHPPPLFLIFELLSMQFIWTRVQMLFSCSWALLEYSFMSGLTIDMNTIGFDFCPLAEALKLIISLFIMVIISPRNLGMYKNYWNFL